MLGIIHQNVSSAFSSQTSKGSVANIVNFVRSVMKKESFGFFSKCAFPATEKPCAQPLKESPSSTLAQQILAPKLSSSIFSSPDPKKALAAAFQKAFFSEIGPCQVSFSAHKKDVLPANCIEVHPEQLSSGVYRINVRYGNSEQSMLSMIFDLIKLGIKHEEADRAFRHILQDYMVVHMERVVENLLNQSKMILYACIASGVLGILGGLLPIIGLMKGKSILKCLSKCFSSLKDVKQEKVFPSLSRAFDAASRTSEMGSRVNTTQSDGLKTRDETMSKQFELRHQEARGHYDERTRRKDSYFSMIERFIEQWWQFIQSICR